MLDVCCTRATGPVARKQVELTVHPNGTRTISKLPTFISSSGEHSDTDALNEGGHSLRVPGFDRKYCLI